MASVLPGYRKLTRAELRARGLPAKSERYLESSTGQTVSRRQYENRRFQATGWNSWSEYQREAKTEQYKRFSRQARKHRFTNPNAADSEFNRLYVEAMRSDFDRSATGPFAEFLEYIGFRKPEYSFDVGDTPKNSS